MKIRIIAILLSLCICSACTVFRGQYKPSDFVYLFDNHHTGLDTMININGYYKSDEPLYTHYTNEPYYKNVMFYSNGIGCYSSYNTNIITSKNPVWGSYILSNDTIKFQTITDNGVMGGLGVDTYIFLVISRTEIKELYPAREGEKNYSFHPLEHRIDSTNWLLYKKWFYKKE